MWGLLVLFPVLLSARPCPGGECVKEHLLLQQKHGVQKVHAQHKAMDAVKVHKEASIVEAHGRLGVIGNKVVDEHGLPIRLRGMSLFWSQWKPQFWTSGTVQWLKEDWGITLLRCPMAVEAGGYLTDPETEVAKLEAVVDAAIAAGIYVIIDWHDHNANNHTEAAKGFFTQMSQKYGQYPNVMFEIFNEPIFQNWTETIKPYHEEVVEVIRQNSNNLIIMGTRVWSQDVDGAAEDPVEGVNLAYTIHFYANTHKQELREKVVKALEAGIAIFATEWGTCDASGDGTLNLEETTTWLDFFAAHNISDANWAVSDKQEACSALLPGADGAGHWEDCELTESGHFVRASLRGETMPATLPTPCPRLTTPPPGQCATSTENCAEKRCCEDIGSKCYQKNEYWASCKASCTPGVDPSDPPEYASPWTCEVLTRDALKRDEDDDEDPGDDEDDKDEDDEDEDDKDEDDDEDDDEDGGEDGGEDDDDNEADVHMHHDWKKVTG